MLISDLGERALIERIHARVPAAPAWVAIGIGDDAAVLEPARGELDVVTTDCQIEDIHFKRAWMSMHDIGRKALAVNISDLAAMGAAPRAATLSLALPASLPVADFDALIDGFLSLAREAKVPLVGGNLSQSPGRIMIDVTLIGSARRRKILTRSGGRAGHLLYVTGTLGRVAAGIARAERGEAVDSLSPVSPVSRLSCGQQVARNRAASACMDISDGLADAVGQLAAASGTGARILSSKIPVDPLATLEQALSGGEDYELLFAVPARRRRNFELIAGQHTDIACIGELTPGADAVLDRDGQVRPLGGGFSHF
jgi:thiamine-monophosphate kinase